MLTDVSSWASARSCFSSLLDTWELCLSLLDRFQILRSEYLWEACEILKSLGVRAVSDGPL